MSDHENLNEAERASNGVVARDGRFEDRETAQILIDPYLPHGPSCVTCG